MTRFHVIAEITHYIEFFGDKKLWKPHSKLLLLQCNNPMTKEPKLDRAMRIAPEWKQYDFKLKKILERAGENGKWVCDWFKSP